MTERILDCVQLTPAIVREWGYDDDLWLSSQDEDLSLLNLESVPVLLELAADPLCPKGGYAVSIVEHFSEITLQRRDAVTARAIAELALSSQYSDSICHQPMLLRWRENYLWLYALLLQPRNVTADEIARIVQLLLIGNATGLHSVRTGRVLNGHDEYEVAVSVFKNYLYVDGEGHWEHARHHPLERIAITTKLPNERLPNG